MNEFLIALSTFPSEEKARQIGTILLEKQLVACINLIPAARSLYRWEGQICDEAETLALMKTTAASFPDLEKELSNLHPYEIPEIIALDISSGNPPYLDWLLRSVTPNQKK